MVRKFLIFLVTFLGYAISFYFLYPVLGRTAGTFVLLPIVVGTVHFGVVGGLVTVIGVFAVNSVVLVEAGFGDLFSASRIVVLLVSLATVGVTHRIRQLSIKRKRYEDRLNIAFEAAYDGLWDYRIPTGEVYYSPRWYTMLGYEPNEFPHEFSSWIALLHPDDRDEAERVISGVIADGNPQFSLTFRLKEKRGTWKWILARGKAVEHDRSGGATRIVGVHSDITELKRAEKELVYLAYHDPLTGLYNRKSYWERSEQTLAQATRATASNKTFALLFVDLSRFKDINDSFGHGVGDQVLRLVAERLNGVLRDSDLLFRFGGDTFAILLTHVSRSTDAAIVVEKVDALFERPFTVEDHILYTAVRIGIAVYPDDADSVSELTRKADAALYAAKREGDLSRFYTHDMEQAALRRIRIVNGLRTAVADDHFTFYYQPIVDDTGSVIAAEALVRWNDPVRGLVAPGDFIPIAEETGLLPSIDRWVLERAAEDLAQWWHELDLQLVVNVNLSTGYLRYPTLLDDIQRAVERAAVPPGTLGIEITESAFLDRTEETFSRLHEIRKLGVRIAIDDFGTGYSSMGYLNRIPATTIKVDRAFVVGLPKERGHRAIVEAIVRIADGFDLAVVAEGIESDAQLEALRDIGCLRYQGYFFSRPLHATAFLAFVHRNRRDNVLPRV
jgi:diguanylate cyclase (GGDEF)-like protein/PAS domain S-box-containing protein